MDRPLSFDEFTDRFLRLYQPPLRARATCSKARQVLDEFGRLTGCATVADLTTDLIAAYIAAGGDRNVNTTISHLRVVKTATLFAHAEGWLARPPQWRRLMPRPARPIRKRHADHDQVVALLQLLRARCPRGWKDRRLHAMACTAAYTGIRAGEMYWLELQDVRPDEGLLWVVGRRRLKTVESEAPVGMPPELAEVLAAWLPESGPRWVFPGVRRQSPWRGGAPGYRPIDHLREAGKEVGIADLGWHMLRHTLGKLLVGKFGASADQAKTVLRHSEIRTTEEFYLHRDDAELLKAIARRVSFRPQA